MVDQAVGADDEVQAALVVGVEHRVEVHHEVRVVVGGVAHLRVGLDAVEGGRDIERMALPVGDAVLEGALVWLVKPSLKSSTVTRRLPNLRLKSDVRRRPMLALVVVVNLFVSWWYRCASLPACRRARTRRTRCRNRAPGVKRVGSGSDPDCCRRSGRGRGR